MSADFLTWNLDDIPDQEPVVAQKALVTIKKATVKTSKNTGRLSLNIMFIIDGQPNALPVWYDLWLPREGDDPTNAVVMFGLLKQFYQGMGYDFSHITGTESLEANAGELIDLQATASLGFEPANLGEGYPAKNTIKALIKVN